MGKPAKRCSRCALDWPDLSEYERCPACEEATDRVENGEPPGQAEAKAEKRRYEFERFCEKGDYERWPEGDERWEGHKPASAVIADAENLYALETWPVAEEAA